MYGFTGQKIFHVYVYVYGSGSLSAQLGWVAHILMFDCKLMNGNIQLHWTQICIVASIGCFVSASLQICWQYQISHTWSHQTLIHDSIREWCHQPGLNAGQSPCWAPSDCCSGSLAVALPQIPGEDLLLYCATALVSVISWVRRLKVSENDQVNQLGRHLWLAERSNETNNSTGPDQGGHNPAVCLHLNITGLETGMHAPTYHMSLPPIHKMASHFYKQDSLRLGSFTAKWSSCSFP